MLHVFGKLLTFLCLCHPLYGWRELQRIELLEAKNPDAMYLFSKCSNKMNPEGVTQ